LGSRQAPDPSISVEERMDGLELGMSQSANDERVRAARVVQKTLKVV